MTATLTILTPLGALAALAALVPAFALLVAERRAERARSLLGLARPGGRSLGAMLVPLVAIPALLGVAAMQPALRSTESRRVRTDVAALFVFDTSRSMLAASSPTGATRLERAKRVALELRASLDEIPVGVATLTDRVLPHLFPSEDRSVFAATVVDALAVGEPPPRDPALRATSFEALGDIRAGNVLLPSTQRRLLVLLTDGESEPFDPYDVARSLGPKETRVLVVHLWRRDERVYAGSARPEPFYRADPQSRAAVEALAGAAGGAVYPEDEVSAAAQDGSDFLGSGPTVERGVARAITPLAPYVALAALVPLAFLLRRRNLG